MARQSRHLALAALATALVAPGLTLLPAASAGADDAGATRSGLPTTRVVKDRVDAGGQRVDVTTMRLRSAAQKGRRASVTAVVPDGLAPGNVMVFYVDTDTDPGPEIAYYAAVDSEFQGFRMKSWTRQGAKLPLRCGRVRASDGMTRARLAFDPRCLSTTTAKVTAFSATFYLVEGSEPGGDRADWLPRFRTFSGRVRSVAG